MERDYQDGAAMALAYCAECVLDPTGRNWWPPEGRGGVPCCVEGSGSRGKPRGSAPQSGVPERLSQTEILSF